jgi:hypothetical protein
MSRRFQAFLFAVAIGLALYAAPLPARAQVTILKNGTDVDQNKVKVLFNTACRVVAEEFHMTNPSSPLFRVTLVLGDSNERLIGDELNHTYFIYMNQRNEVLFATSASRLALQHLVSQERKARIVTEILRRANRIEPVPYDALFDLKRGRRLGLEVRTGTVKIPDPTRSWARREAPQ